MYSDKDNFCFCVPIGVAVVLVCCSVLSEIMMAFTARNSIAALIQAALLVTFVITGIYRQSIGVRRCLAYSYAVVFVLYIVLMTFFVYDFFA